MVVNAFAQDDLFGTPKKEPKKGLVIGFNGNFDMPLADMADRFGLSYRIGPSLQYKTKSNWLLGAKADFIFGNKIKEDSLMANMITVNDGVIGYSQVRIYPERFERGYILGLQVGKILNFSRHNSDNGLFLSATAGFIQHKILIHDQKGQVSQLKKEYRKGYDRLVNGLFIEPYIGYVHFAKNTLLNFHIGLDALVGFTQGRRDFLYDVRRPGNEKRLDVLFGIRGGWYLPVFKRKSEEYFFE